MDTQLSPTNEIDGSQPPVTLKSESAANDAANDDPFGMESENDAKTGADDTSTSPKRKPKVKGINHFSFCDRATQTSDPATRVKKRAQFKPYCKSANLSHLGSQCSNASAVEAEFQRNNKRLDGILLLIGDFMQNIIHILNS